MHMFDFSRCVSFYCYDGVSMVTKAVDNRAYVCKMMVRSKIQVLVCVGWFMVHSHLD
jgi:hypothetical protein